MITLVGFLEELGILSSGGENSSSNPSEQTMYLAEKITIWTVYAITLFFFAFKPHILGYGRPLIALLGASVVVLVQDLTPMHRQDIEQDVDTDILVYLFGLMIISHYMFLTGLVRIPNSFFYYTLRKGGPVSLIWVFSFTAGAIAIFFTNDMTAFLLTPIIVRLTNDKKYPELQGTSFIFLMLLSTTANLASAMSPIGNPQNVLVASMSGISFGDFMYYLSIPTLFCWLGNTFTLTVWFLVSAARRRKQLEGEKLLLGEDTTVTLHGNLDDFSSASILNAESNEEFEQLLRGGVKVVEDRSDDSVSNSGTLEYLAHEMERANRIISPVVPPKIVGKMNRTVFRVVTICSAIIFILWIILVTVCDVFLGWSTLLAALMVVTVHTLACYFCNVSYIPPQVTIFQDPEVVDFGLIFMFHAQFILIGSLLDTGWPQYVFDLLLGSVGDQIVDLWYVMVFTFSIMAASNLLTNVPVVLLLEPLINGLSDPKIGWLLVAFSTTVGGNLTLVGSACNLIVDARSRSIGGPELRFFQYLWFGCPTTLMWIFLGTLSTVLIYNYF